jgi:hypothetical protein
VQLQSDQLPKSNSAEFAKGWTLDRLSETEMKVVATRMVDGDEIVYARELDKPF